MPERPVAPCRLLWAGQRRGAAPSLTGDTELDGTELVQDTVPAQVCGLQGGQYGPADYQRGVKVQICQPPTRYDQPATEQRSGHTAAPWADGSGRTAVSVLVSLCHCCLPVSLSDRCVTVWCQGHFGEIGGVDAGVASGVRGSLSTMGTMTSYRTG